jgi:hypothetical protein
MRSITHLDNRELDSLFDRELPSCDLARILLHLDECAMCECRVEAAKAPCVEYSRWT